MTLPKLIKLEEIDKTKLERVATSDYYLALVFSDGTACIFNAERGWEGEYAGYSTADDIHCFDLSELRDLGFLSEQEYDEAVRQKDAKYRADRQAEQELKDQKEYQRLKAKFEGSPAS